MIAVIACLVLAAIAGTIAVVLKRSSSGDNLANDVLGGSKRAGSKPKSKRKRELLPPLPEPLFGRAAGSSVSPSVPSFRLVPAADESGAPASGDDNTDGAAAKAAPKSKSSQAPASMGLSPSSSEASDSRVRSSGTISPMVSSNGSSNGSSTPVEKGLAENDPPVQDESPGAS
jgi:hypothetical protein